MRAWLTAGATFYFPGFNATGIGQFNVLPASALACDGSGNVWYGTGRPKRHGNCRGYLGVGEHQHHATLTYRVAIGTASNISVSEINHDCMRYAFFRSSTRCRIVIQVWLSRKVTSRTLRSSSDTNSISKPAAAKKSFGLVPDWQARQKRTLRNVVLALVVAVSERMASTDFVTSGVKLVIIS
jgi:hypothetical protein